MNDGKAPEVILVFPKGRHYSWYCDSADGTKPVETVIIKELIPHIDRTYRTVARREGRAIEGSSMGGFGKSNSQEQTVAVGCLGEALERGWSESSASAGCLDKADPRTACVAR